MAEIPKIVLPHGGYRKLIVYRKSRLDGAATAGELAARADEMRDAISRAVWSIKRKKNW